MDKSKSNMAPNLEITLDQLKALMETRGKETITKLDTEFDGTVGICKRLDVDPQNGLDPTPANIEARQLRYGKNKITFTQSKSFLSLMFTALQDKTLIMLQICAVLSLALSFYNPPKEDEKDIDPYNRDNGNKYGYIEGVAIIISILIIVLVSAGNDYSKERQFKGLQKRLEKEQKITLVRNQSIDELEVSGIVVGDIIVFKYGDVIPVDGIILESNGLKIDESSLTGETKLVPKGVASNNIILFSGTHVMEGTARMIVTAVGMNSQAGVICNLMKNTDGSSGKEKSVLQSKLGELALKIGYCGITVAIIVILMLIIRFCITKLIIEKQKFRLYYFKYFVRFIITGITILIIAVPEGLPLAVTLALAYSVKQMMKDNNLVRHLDACETMGNATTICSDKTGTLTANRMTSVQCFICGIYYKNLSKRYLDLPNEVVTLLSQGIAINSAYTSRLVIDDHNTMRQFGNRTECALLGFLYKINVDYQQIRDGFSQSYIHRIYPFNSIIKLMRTIIKLPDNRGYRLMAKGASEIILKQCGYMVGLDGKILKLPMPEKDKIINEVIKPMAQNGLRTICLGYVDYLYQTVDSIPANCKTISDDNIDWDSEESFSDMTCLAVVGIEDPVRKDVPQAIKKCQKSGITVRMVTGDNVDTAKSIAIKCGIINLQTAAEEQLTLESKEFNKLIRNEKGVVDQALFDKVWPNLRVLARSTPNDKYILVKHIIESKLTTIREVVAVTGDGTNDAPALKMADVGFAMGIAGTEVAKEASDIILTDDNFSSIVKSVIWGRNVYDSISKFIQFQLTVNVVAVLIAFISACVIQDSPLKAVQMLWVNLIMDTLGSLALSTEKPSKALLLRKPYGRTKSLISSSMLKIIVGNAIYQLVVILALLFHGHIIFDIDSGIELTLNTNTYTSVHFTMIFNIFVFMTLFNEINARKINGERNIFIGLFSNGVFCSIFGVTLVLQVLIIQYGSISFTTSPLTLYQWMWCITIGFSMLIWGQIVTALTLKQRKYSWIGGLAHVFSTQYLPSNTNLRSQSLSRNKPSKRN